MNREEYEQLTASLLYGEISEEERRRLDEWWDAHPEDRADYGELQKTFALLHRMSEEPASSVPLRAAALPVVRRKQSHRLRWAIAAAACLAFGFLAVSQGLVIQIGQARLALGPTVENAALRAEIRQEIAANYLPTLKLMADNITQIQKNTALTFQRQDTLENSVRVLTTLRDTDQQYTDRKIERFAVELGKILDERLNRLYPVSTVAYLNQPMPGDDAKTPESKPQ